MYRLAQDFLRIEALTTQAASTATPADPIALVVTVIDSINLNTVERITTSQTTRLWRAAIGRWIVELDPNLLQAGKSYTVTYSFSMHPGTENVIRTPFIWQPLPALPHDPEHCLITGRLLDIQGMPLANQRLVVEQYVDVVTLSRRTQQLTVQTDQFGLWYAELPYDALVRVVFNDITKVIRVPRVQTAQLGSIPSLQLKNIARVDRFGYPLPGTEPEAWAPEDTTPVVTIPGPAPVQSQAVLSQLATAAIEQGRAITAAGGLAVAGGSPAIGIAVTSAHAGTSVAYVTEGLMSQVNLIPGAVYYVGNGEGLLTADPTGLPSRQIVGTALSPTVLRVAIGPLV